MMAALILATTFVMHLLLRAHWIALVGLNSVHPDGVLWENLRFGRRLFGVEQKALGTMSDAIERADNRATIVFGVGVSMAMQIGKMLVLVVVLAAICYVAGMFFPVSGWSLPASWSVEAGFCRWCSSWRIDLLLGDRLQTGWCPPRERSAASSAAIR